MAYRRYKGYRQQSPSADVSTENGLLVLRSSYDDGLVSWIKGLPYQDRTWNGDSKTWTISPKHGNELSSAVFKFLGIKVNLPSISAVSSAPQRLVADMLYIGGAYERAGQTERTATGYINGEWAWIFPESVLLTWFGGKEAKPTSILSHYAVLGVPSSATDDEIKKAYRRASKTWHPDVSMEVDADRQFKRINHAYEVLKDPYKRERYDAGLKLEAKVGFGQRQSTEKAYFTPLRCGKLEVVATPAVAGKYVINEIKSWQDIVQNGKMLVTTWPKGYEKFIEQWVEV